MIAPSGATTRRILAVSFAILLCGRTAGAEKILAQISVPSHHLRDRYYDQVYQFPATTRDYSEKSLFGYSFREELPNGAVRELEIGQLRSRGAYLMATDLFANGRFSTMSHTVLMVFPRAVPSGADLYQLSEDAFGDLRITAPDGSALRIDGRTGALRSTRDFALASQGPPGTPPGLRHRGLHLEIHSAGRNPFLRGTAATFVDENGWTCRLTTDELFRYDGGLESDVFRFEEDSEFFAYLSARCSGLRLPRLAGENVKALPGAAGDSVPILIPASSGSSIASASGGAGRPPRSQPGGTLPLFWKLFSN